MLNGSALNIELWNYLEKCYGLEDPEINYFIDTNAFNSLIPYLSKKIYFLLIGRLKNPSMVLNK